MRLSAASSSAVQPGGSLFGLQESNPVDTNVAYGGNASQFGRPNDPMVGERIGGSSFEGWINAQVMLEGLRRAGKDLSREQLRQGLASIKQFDLGGFMVNYAQSPFVGSRYIDMAVFGAGGRRM